MLPAHTTFGFSRRRPLRRDARGAPIGSGIGQAQGCAAESHRRSGVTWPATRETAPASRSGGAAPPA